MYKCPLKNQRIRILVSKAVGDNGGTGLQGRYVKKRLQTITICWRHVRRSADCVGAQKRLEFLRLLMATVWIMQSFWSFPLAILDVLRQMGFGLYNVTCKDNQLEGKRVWTNENAVSEWILFWFDYWSPHYTCVAANSVLQAARHIPWLALILSWENMKQFHFHSSTTRNQGAKRTFVFCPTPFHLFWPGEA